MGDQVKRCLMLAVALSLAGCATYSPLPLTTQAHAPHDPASIKVDASTMSLPPLRHHVFDPRHGLDMTDVAMLAVVNNPQLKLARDERGIGHAQAFAARLLPDPVLDLARGYPTGGPAVTTSYGLGLSYDIGALLTHGLSKRAANASACQVDLNVLWQEWQVVGASRQLFVRNRYEARMLALLRKEAALREKHHALLVQAQAHGDVSLTAIGADLDSLQAVQLRRNRMERQLLKTRQALNALLGLSPQARLTLVGSDTLPVIDAAQLASDIAALPRRRPDLLALAAGYRSADARYRKAIWQQFPAINVGFTRARDTDAIGTRGFQVSLSLPLFNRNRGHISIAKATRQKLHDAYSVRLLNARHDVERIVQDQSLLERQRVELQQGVTFSDSTLAHERAVAAAGDVSAAEQLQLEANGFARRLELLGIDESLLEQQVALRTLVGWTSPVTGVASSPR